jgi:glutamate-ammonia-ligase adenylyltransferase
MARGLASDPLLLEVVATDPAGIAPFREEDSVVADPAGEKARGELSAGLRHLLGITDLDGLTDDLASVADRIVRGFFDRIARKGKRAAPPSLAVLALGKYGTREILFDADLDLLFLCADAGGGTHSLEQTAGRILQGLTSASDRGHLYEADARLRPEGKNAPLVVSVPAYDRYLRERASLWERQSLTRLRRVAGEGEWLASALAMVERFVYGSPLPAGWTEEIVTMRKRMETRSRFRGAGPIDVKVGPGGMVDVEFIAQMIQLRHGEERKDLRGCRTVEVLQKAGPDLLPAGGGEILTHAYRRYREMEKLLRLTLEQHGMLLPEGEPLETLARCAGAESGQGLVSEITRSMKQVREIFLEMSRRLR